MTTNPAVNDPEVLEMLYWQENLSMWEIAQRLSVSETTVYRRMEEFGIDRRGIKEAVNNGNRLEQLADYAAYTVKDGYPVWRGNNTSDGFSTTFVHQLLLIAEGADPHKVYSKEYECHHKNEIKWDNRPDNLVLWTREKHSRYHANKRDLGKTEGTWSKYTEEEMLEWIDSFVMEFGFVPSNNDIKNWPGPTPETYVKWFGSFPKAVEKAGYEPRSK